ncbi:unnamed protein product [Timema podura]|uniref:Gustatory receptor n=1 Tax=Timema podura TaxID=61482 RepID=A0ABN7NN62_TIMPD|nr:unnamed protein product [Timema podura]
MSFLENLVQKECFNFIRPKRAIFITLECGTMLLIASYGHSIYEFELQNIIVFIVELTLYLVQLHFIFLVLMIREHLTYINQRLDGSINKWEEVVLLSEHRAIIVYVAHLGGPENPTEGPDSPNTDLSTSLVLRVRILVLMIREHLVYINHRLDGSVIKCVEVDILAEHRGGIFGVVRLVNAAYSVQVLSSFSYGGICQVKAAIHKELTARQEVHWQFETRHIIAALTTYLIILIQFQLSDQPAKEDQRERNVIHCLNLLNQTNSSYAVN